jgi:hypothetical protein
MGRKEFEAAIELFCALAEEGYVYIYVYIYSKTYMYLHMNMYKHMNLYLFDYILSKNNSFCRGARYGDDAVELAPVFFHYANALLMKVC